ncbi:uncharacterized protein PSANT_06150 [Moesziomyces antarcticus]|uniref:Uncharacterized protein n=1 Tax=Pseudozyma antarctica TaxID=84753 RepID=A0A5C3FYB6_PSEA2|nr:uncharacterized protein PSANT_06150 [Moesziomyces antarcticus]
MTKYSSLAQLQTRVGPGQAWGKQGGSLRAFDAEVRIWRAVICSSQRSAVIGARPLLNPSRLGVGPIGIGSKRPKAEPRRASAPRCKGCGRCSGLRSRPDGILRCEGFGPSDVRQLSHGARCGPT